MSKNNNKVSWKSILILRCRKFIHFVMMVHTQILASLSVETSWSPLYHTTWNGTSLDTKLTCIWHYVKTVLKSEEILILNKVRNSPGKLLTCSLHERVDATAVIASSTSNNFSIGLPLYSKSECANFNQKLSNPNKSLLLYHK